MALTGLDIYKQLPKTNCKECGLPTCLAFAMKVAGGQAGLEDCPHLSDDARGTLDEASAPPQRLVKIGPDSAMIEIGQETVLYRHDERFHHPTAVALVVSDTTDEGALKKACEDFKSLQFLRVGETIHPDMIALTNDSGSPETFKSAAATIHNAAGVGLVLISEKVDALSSAAGAVSGARPVLYCTSDASADELAGLAKRASAPVCVAGDIESVAQKVEALGKKEVKDVLISPGRVSTTD
ncbi:unnamed protein product, partial [marine sediment metagenome]